MKNIDFKQIRSAIALLLISALLSAAAIYWVNQHAESMDAETRTLQGQKEHLRQQQMAQNEQRRIYREYARDYARLQSTGTFDSDARLNWIEEIEHAVQTLGIPMTSYEIGSRAAATKPVNGSGQLGLYQTPIKIEFELLHEADLLRVLDYLSSANLGLYEVEKCAIDRQDGNSPNNEATQLKADCTLISYTFVFDDRQEDPMLPPII
jgi:type II secretory pathway pseudopilin PulG